MTVLTRTGPLVLRTLLGASIVCKANMPANHGRPRVHVILNGGGKRLPNLLRFRELRFALYALYMPVAPEPSDVVTPTWSTLQCFAYQTAVDVRASGLFAPVCNPVSQRLLPCSRPDIAHPLPPSRVICPGLPSDVAD